MSSMGGRRGPYNQASEIENLNPREFYFDGVFETYVPPALVLSSRPAGSAYADPSDYRKTRAGAHRPGTRDRHREGQGFARDITGDPWASDEPEWTQGGGPSGPGMPWNTHDAYPEPLDDPRTLSAMAAPPAPEDVPSGGLLGFLSGSFNGFDWLRGIYNTSPVAALFIALAGIVVVNGLVFKSRRVSRASTSTAQAAAAPSQAAEGVGGAAIEGVNKVVKEAAEAVDDIVPGG
jgi:hypothetical protein